MSDGGDSHSDASEATGKSGFVADPRLLALCDRWLGDVRSLHTPLDVREPRARIHIEPEAWGAGYLAVHERDIPPELIADLNAVTPQALLRDLHRPVRSVPWVERTELAPPIDRAGLEALREARSSIAREPVPHIEESTRTMSTERSRRRAWLAERWQPALADDAPRRRLTTPAYSPFG